MRFNFCNQYLLKKEKKSRIDENRIPIYKIRKSSTIANLDGIGLNYIDADVNRDTIYVPMRTIRGYNSSAYT